MELLQPAALWLAALAAPLVALYLLKPRRDELKVSATFLWREARELTAARVPFRRLRRDLLLLLQLLILLLLILAAAMPVVERLVATGERVAIVVDGSASMRAGTRFAEALEQARTLVDAAPDAESVTILLAGAEPRVVAPLGGTAPALRAALETLSPEAGRGSLAKALPLAARLVGREGRVVVLGDGCAPWPAGARGKLMRVGAPLDNAGIVAVGVRAQDGSGANHELFVRVLNASPASRSGLLSLERDGRALDAKRLVLPPERETGATLKLEGARGGRFTLRFVDDEEDLFESDNVVALVLPDVGARRYRVVGRAPYLERALAADSQWQRVVDADAPVDVEITVGEPPREVAAAVPRLIVDPRVPGVSRARLAHLLSWERSHPSLRHVDFGEQRFGDLPSLTRAPGEKVLAHSSAGPMILERGHGARRELVWAFHPRRSELPLSPVFPILVRNTLEYLAAEADAALPVHAAGSTPRLAWPDTEPVRWTTPSSEDRTLQPRGGELALPPLLELGLHGLAGGDTERVIAVALLDAEESELRPRMTTETTAEDVAEGRQRVGTRARALWRYAALLALALILIEAVVWSRRWAR